MRHAFKWLVVAGATGLPWLAPGFSNAAVTHPSALWPGQGTVYVSPGGAAGAADRSCGTAAFSSVQAAVTAVPAQGTVIVCAGTYDESVTITESLTLAGRPGAVINAIGQQYGVGVAASYVTVSGLTVENASIGGTLADGILTAGAVNAGDGVGIGNHVTIIRDVTENNDGSGIDLNSTTYSSAIDDVSTGNSVGINVSDDFGQPATGNSIIGNVADDNAGGCGIALADHTGVGISNNRVIGNISDDNGLGTSTGTSASAGSGVILAGIAGGVFDNTITRNTFNGNGHAGVDVHAHVAGMNMTGNVITGNWIGVNNLRGSEGDADTTGIYLGDASRLTITVRDNFVSGDYYGVFEAGGPVTVNSVGDNFYTHVTSVLGTSPTFS
jgi:nitrous oxidase accessory protein NosD